MYIENHTLYPRCVQLLMYRAWTRLKPKAQSFGVPFSWENSPGVRKKSHFPRNRDYEDPYLQLLPLPPAARSAPTTELKKLRYNYVGRDPFTAALVKCSKKDLHKKSHVDDYWKIAKPSRAVNDLVGIVDRYTSCKTTCSVVDSTKPQFWSVIRVIFRVDPPTSVINCISLCVPTSRELLHASAGQKQSALQATKWVENDEAIEIHYLHNNRQAFTLIKCSRGVREGHSRLTGLNVFEDVQNALGRRTNNLKGKSVGDHRGCPVSTTRSLKALGCGIYNFEANVDIRVNSLHSCDTIYPTVDIEEDIETIFSFSPDHFALQDSHPRAINDDPTIGDKMQEDVGICIETLAVGEDTNIEDTLVPVNDFKHELLESRVFDHSSSVLNSNSALSRGVALFRFVAENKDWTSMDGSG
ncbi:hypothetical protein MRB53_023933 [Persea americana]|uniref:Uncharacterized protein n=1 Tax=Persea americana TaxID=3435 RepID=A0ACC2LB95_PERAE|nr:hypothetical protein MRB53_023933 [Persea americana]